MVSNLTGPPDTDAEPSPVPDAETKVEPASQLEPAEAAPPTADRRRDRHVGRLLVLMLLFLFLL